MLGNSQLANQRADNLVGRSRSPSMISFTKSMATYQVKVKYGEERLSTFLIKDTSFAKVMQAIKQNFSPPAHLPTSNIRVRCRDEDGDMIHLSEDPDDFAFGEMLRSAKEGKGKGKGKGTPYLTSEVPLLSREYSPRKPTVRSFYPPLSISAPF